MRVHDTDHLVLWFKDAVSPATPLPATQPVREPVPAEQVATKPVNQEPKLPGTAPVPAAPGPVPANAPANPAKPKKPMDFSARYVEAHVLRSGTNNELDKLWCV